MFFHIWHFYWKRSSSKNFLVIQTMYVHYTPFTQEQEFEFGTTGIVFYYRYKLSVIQNVLDYRYRNVATCRRQQVYRKRSVIVKHFRFFDDSVFDYIPLAVKHGQCRQPSRVEEHVQLALPLRDVDSLLQFSPSSWSVLVLLRVLRRTRILFIGIADSGLYRNQRLSIW